MSSELGSSVPSSAAGSNVLPSNVLGSSGVEQAVCVKNELSRAVSASISVLSRPLGRSLGEPFHYGRSQRAEQ